MSDPVSALGAASFDGFAAVREIGPLGMISLRARPDVPGLAGAILAVTGTAVPGQRRIEVAGDCAAGWMSPDEYLLILPYGDTGSAMAALAAALRYQCRHRAGSADIHPGSSSPPRNHPPLQSGAGREPPFR